MAVPNKVINIAGKNFELASRLSRWGTQLLDGFISIIILVLGVIILMFDEDNIIAFLLILIGLPFWLYYILFQDAFKNGQSIGKKLLGIQVIDAKNGKPCSSCKSFIRNGVLIILGFFDVLFFFGKKRQRLGDKLANTLVVKKGNEL